MSILFYTIIAILVLQFILETVLDYLNAKRYNDPIPEELNDVFDADEYKKSQAYKKTNYRFGLLTSTFSFLLTLSFLVFGGFEWIDQLVRSVTTQPIPMALMFFGIIMIGSDVVTLPLSYYSTFVIEEKFGFNKTTKGTFFLDKIKGWLMTAVVGGLLLAVIIWFFQWAGNNFWLYAWALVSFFTVFMNLFYSKLIVPLFNKQTPLEDGSLKTKIEAFAKNVGFELNNIFVIDGSKR
ncbi:M48 family metallopeptidase, partial [Zobellia laminariae]|uniref:M48 family metallopeptidase n=1 Tax=Zobellia laminariae TaxID=248906 RepID=UPI0040579719